MANNLSMDDFVDQECTNLYIQHWDAHCRLRINSSNPKDFIDCEGYKNLVRCGKAGLPFIYQAVQEDKFDGRDFGWFNHIPRLIIDIVGDDFKVPKGIEYNVYERRDYAINWLGDYVQKLD